MVFPAQATTHPLWYNLCIQHKQGAAKYRGKGAKGDALTDTSKPPHESTHAPNSCRSWDCCVCMPMSTLMMLGVAYSMHRVVNQALESSCTFATCVAWHCRRPGPSPKTPASPPTPHPPIPHLTSLFSPWFCCAMHHQIVLQRNIADASQNYSKELHGRNTEACNQSVAVVPICV